MKFLTGLPRHATGGLVAGGIVGGLTPCLSQHSLIVSISFTLVWLMVVSLQLHFVWLALGALVTTAAIAVFPRTNLGTYMAIASTNTLCSNMAQHPTTCTA